ncbi:hypothetical protein EVAR_92812_1 [Eumeta japonica]|uniref:DUF4817 domain-containing protein n=1 Tax=Eumeta variegata TaxID=151549 RepID=A0A4C1TCU0_EUMVA|nr:hypothetical protein EVAR_92812_1 [Eumeta japonica]
MAAFTNEEYADIMMAYGRADGNAREARRIYEERFPNRRLPSRSTFQNTYRRLRETGHVQNNETRGVVVRHNVRIDEQILRLFEEDGARSIRNVASLLEISIWKVWKVLRQNNKHAFHYTPVQGKFTTV